MLYIRYVGDTTHKTTNKQQTTQQITLQILSIVSWGQAAQLFSEGYSYNYYLHCYGWQYQSCGAV